MKLKTKYRVIGIMSGTSLDGLDIVCCEYLLKNRKWSFEFIVGETMEYTPTWKLRLSNAHLLPGLDLQKLDNEFGSFIGLHCARFIKKQKIKDVDFIASHGHTVFHQPDKGLTYQIGNGAALSATSDLPVINDFRSMDVRKGGQGAPLVPVGDHHLFSEFDVCLNLGGIANLSLVDNNKRRAFDVCFANMGLNHLAGKIHKSFDENGREASLGIVDAKMLNELRKVYKRWRKLRPSIGREGFEKFIQPLLDDGKISLQNKLRSLCESISDEIALSVPQRKKRIRVLATGGGAFNSFLIGLIQEKIVSRAELILPEDKIVNYKEAIVFGFLGVLRARNETNVLKSVTGGSSDSSAGSMIGF